MEVLGTIFLVVFAITAVFIIILVLLQDEQGEGFGGLFGGGSTTPFNMTSGNILTKTTAVLGAVFMVTSLLVALLYENNGSDNVISESRQSAASQVDWFTEEALETDTTVSETDDAAGIVDPGAETGSAGIEAAESGVQESGQESQ